MSSTGVGATTTKQNSSEEGSDWRSPQWSSLASSYFESEFEAPFSDSDDGEMQESLSSASGGSTGPEDSEGDKIPVDKKPSESESSFQLSPVAAVIKSTQCDEGTAEYKLGSSSETPLSREMEGSSPSGRQRLSIPTEEQGLSQSPPSERYECIPMSVLVSLLVLNILKACTVVYLHVVVYVCTCLLPLHCLSCHVCKWSVLVQQHRACTFTDLIIKNGDEGYSQHAVNGCYWLLSLIPRAPCPCALHMDREA